MKRSLLVVCAALAVLPALSACGLRGRLERPTPMWGNPPDEGPRDPRRLKAEKEQADAEKAKRKAEEDQARAQRAAGEQTAPTPAAPAAPN